jgi:hypothetical protein
MNKKPTSVALCSASYRAQQVPGAVLIFADGMHPTSGYQAFFEQSPIDVFPPEFILWHVAPSGIVLQVLTPFTVYTSFKTTGQVERVAVHDANGRHEVGVEQVPDRLLKHAR